MPKRRSDFVNRLTEKSIGTFAYELKDHTHKTKEFNDYDAFFAYNKAVKRLGELEDANEPKPIEEWHEDHGDVIWWKLPIEEPPYVGTPLDSDFEEGYYTHFTRLIEPLDIDD